MKKATCLTDNRRWQSVLARDPNADGEFVFAVRTTGIFAVRLAAPDMLCGKTSPLRKCQQGTRRWLSPCKRCQPDKANAQQHRLNNSPTPVDCWNRKRL
ncbi:Ada metal-binding domain-containing protein [Shigella flexneri]